MGDLQATIEFVVELHKFFNVDLFQRGLYQVRCGLRVSPRLPVQVETSIPEASGPGKQNGHANGASTDHGSSDSERGELSPGEVPRLHESSPGGSCSSASVINGSGASRIFQILYRNEEVPLRDIIHFRSHLLVDSRHLKESIERAEFSLQLELWFGEQNGSSSLNGNGNGSGMGSFSGPASSALTLASTRNLQLNFHPGRGLHYHLPVLFDYFHLAAISVGIHASLVALHQPYIK
ncbi:protein FAM135A isoform X2 [Drosophila santomea]|nr:protein FAM135A isoform X2 [Drosophila santomea]